MRSVFFRPTAVAWFAGFLIVAAPVTATAQVSLPSLGSTYQQNFDTLANTGTTGSALPAGWAFSEAGSGANTTYGINDGSSNTFNTYSYGSTGSTDRAFGSLGGLTLITTLGASFQNDTGAPLTGVTISYTGEQWRRGNGNQPDRLDFATSTDATSLTTGTWTDANALDLSSPVISGPRNSARDGNDPSNQASLSSTITFATPVATGATFFIRWVDFNSTAQEDALAIDSFNITPVPEPATVLGVSAIGLGVIGWARRRRKTAAV